MSDCLRDWIGSSKTSEPSVVSFRFQPSMPAVNIDNDSVINDALLVYFFWAYSYSECAPVLKVLLL